MPADELIVHVPVVEDPVVEVTDVEVPVVMDEVSDVEEQVPNVEVVVDEAHAAVDEVSFADTYVMTRASTKPSVYSDGAFPEEHIDRSVLTGYDDHVAFRIWQGRSIYVIFFISNHSLWLD